MKVELSEQQIKNLEEFLSRVDLKGDEALAFTDIIMTIRNSVKDKEMKKEE